VTRLRVAVLLVAFLLPGCGFRGLNFIADDRVTFIAPDDRAEVRLPLTVSWRVRDFEVTGNDGRRRRDAGYFGVFVDRAPQPPSQTLDWIVRDDARCRDRTACDEAYLAQLNIHSTTETTFEIDRLPTPSSDAVRRREFHEVTVVLLDGSGRRIGESAFTRQFEVDRDG
jgi:hypothetical protein